jgi:hypothetical protein
MCSNESGIDNSRTFTQASADVESTVRDATAPGKLDRAIAGVVFH